MKTMKKHLALLLTLAMLLGLVVVSTAITVSADPTAILEIDFSALSQEQLTPSDSGITPPNSSGVTASGTLAASTAIGFSQRPDSENSLTKGSFQNNNGGAMTYYLDYYDSKIWPNTASTGTSYANHLTNMQFQNTGLESSDNTISFWVNDIQRSYDYVLKSVFTYRVDFNSTNRESFDLVVNPNGTWNLYSEPWIQASNGIHNPMSMDTGAFSVPAGWKHIVITNPARDNGSKTMELYINGEFKSSVTLSIPDDATINHATATFFGKSTAEEAWWRARYNNLASGKLADVKVYDTALDSTDVAALYSAQTPNFTEYVAPVVTLTKALSLDMSNFAQVQLTPSDSTGEVTSGIVKSGDLASSTTVSFSQRPDGENSLTKASFLNSADGTTYYIDYSDSKIWPNTASQAHAYANHLTNLQFFNNELENTDNMISFWVNDIQRSYDYVLKSVFTYRVDFNSTNRESFDLVVNPNGTWNLYSEPWIQAANGIHNPMSMDDGAFTVPSGWKHVLITNPVRSGNAKQMDLYINGVLKKSVTLDIPDNATINHVTATFFGKSNDEYWRANYNNLASGKLGGIGVYTGPITSQNISDIYTDELPYFTPLRDIEGYSANNVSLQYDGNSHNIEIVAAQGATEGVSVSYTCGGEPFNGATQPGLYEVTAIISKSGYNNLELTANLLIVAPLGAKLVDLDISGFIPQQTSGTSGIVNVGTSNTTELEIHGATGTYGTRLVEDLLYNKNDFTDTKSVLRFRIVNEAAYTNEPVRTSVFKIKDPAIEAQPVTVSLWVNIDPSSGQQWANAYASILQYNALRDDDEFRTQGIRNIDGVDKLVNIADSRASVWQYNLDSMTDYYWGKPWDYNMKIVNDQTWWHHLVLTIPQWDQEGKKTCTAYVDGGSRTMTFDLDLDGHQLKDSWLSIASNENNVYSPSDISISDVAVYSGELTALQVAYLYEDEKDFYVNKAARNKLHVTYSGNEINEISGVTANGGTITVSYDENIGDADGVRLLVGSYTEDNELLTANTVIMDGAGSLTLNVPAGAHKVMIFTWDATDYKVIQKFTKLINAIQS